MVLKLGHFGKQSRNAWTFLNVSLENDGEDHIIRSCEE